MLSTTSAFVVARARSAVRQFTLFLALSASKVLPGDGGARAGGQVPGSKAHGLIVADVDPSEQSAQRIASLHHLVEPENGVRLGRPGRRPLPADGISWEILGFLQGGGKPSGRDAERRHARRVRQDGSDDSQ